jgi:hypothetical protein
MLLKGGDLLLKYVSVLLVCLLISCAGTKVIPVCRHKAVYTAISYGDIENKKVRIVVGPSHIIDNKWIFHAQAQAYVNGSWEWLVLDYGEVGIGNLEHFQPKYYYTVQEFMTKYFGREIM